MSKTFAEQADVFLEALEPLRVEIIGNGGGGSTGVVAGGRGGACTSQAHSLLRFANCRQCGAPRFRLRCEYCLSDGAV